MREQPQYEPLLNDAQASQFLGGLHPKTVQRMGDGATFHTIAWASTTAIVLVNSLHGSCYILRARLTRLLSLERKPFNERAISKWLLITVKHERLIRMFGSSAIVMGRAIGRKSSVPWRSSQRAKLR